MINWNTDIIATSIHVYIVCGLTNLTPWKNGNVDPRWPLKSAMFINKSINTSSAII